MTERLRLPEEFGQLYACSAERKHLQHEAAHGLLCRSLPLYGAACGLCIPEEVPRLQYGEFGKPRLADYPLVQCNLSHCDGMAVCLFSPHVCGVDAESIRSYRARVAGRVCSAEEQDALAAAENQDLLFTRLWTLKEAYVKAIGIGVSYPMRQVSFTLEENRIVSSKPEASFAQLLLPHHVVSVCVLAQLPEQPVLYCNQQSCQGSL